MVWIDRRKGSGELLPHFATLRTPAEKTDLEYADFHIPGNGPRGPWDVGVERKALRDMLNCISDPRYSGLQEGGQMYGMLQTYDVSYLVVEGAYRADPVTGLIQVWDRHKSEWRDLQIGQRRFMASELERFLLQVSLETPVRVWRTRSTAETARLVADLHHQLQKPWEDHRSCRGLRVPVIQEPARLTKPGPEEVNVLLRRTVAMCFTGVGLDTGKAAAGAFPSARHMANAGELQWRAVDGIGKTRAASLVKEWTNG